MRRVLRRALPDEVLAAEQLRDQQEDVGRLLCCLHYEHDFHPRSVSLSELDGR